MTDPVVLVAGALHHDTVVRADRLPALDETLRGHRVAYVSGGKCGNQAVAAAAIVPTAAVARIGDDHAGAALLANLDAAGVDRSRVAVAPGEASGMSVAIVDAAGDYGAVIVSAASLGIDVAAVAIPDSVRVVLLQNEIPEAANLALARQARAAGVRVILNAAPARPFTTGLRALVDLLIVNRVEAAGLTGRTIETIDDAIAAAGSLGGIAIVTLGADGAVLADGAAHHFPAARADAARADAARADIVSSHGAGDALAGALAARIALGADLEAALSDAQAAAARHVSRAG